MKKGSLLICCLVMAVQFLVLPSAALPAELPLSEAGQSHWNAPENSPVITEDGSLDLVKIDFVHYAKSSSATKIKLSDPGYDLMGVKWLWQEGYAVNLTNAPDTISSGALDAIKAASTTWDAATKCTKTTREDLFDQSGITLDGTAEYGVYDGINAIAFGSYQDANVIAVTTVWYSPATKAIYEFDMLFNTDFNWSTSGSDTAMDLQNIATHEFGHAVGLADIYNAAYSDVTMYGYSTYGETLKRDLAEPDITGLCTIYGK